MPKSKDELISVNEAGRVLSELLTKESKLSLEINTFDNFVQDVFAKAYPDRSYNTWHVRKVATYMDELMKTENKMGVVVLPRYHLKSTLCGYAFSVYRMLCTYGEGFYCSYKEDLANYHRSQIKKHIAENPLLSPIFKDLRVRSDFEIYYKIGAGRRVHMSADGIFSVKRGLHTDIVTIVDDILGTVENPMTPTELVKAETMFDAEVVNIPNRGCPLILFGTVMSYDDVLFHKSKNPEFSEPLWLPAEHPDNVHDVLWHDRYPMDWLQRRKGTIGWKAYATEFLLTPVMATEGFFTPDELHRVVNKNLRNHSFYDRFDKEDKHVVAGFDTGKRKNPSHMAIFVDNEKGELIQIHSSFYDQMDYETQISYINQAIEAFQIDRLYYDNSRSELEDRKLPRQCVPIKFTGRGERNRATYAANFSTAVENNRIQLLDDDRMISQALAITKDLKAIESPLGHADSFWSIALACGCYEDNYAPFRRKGFAYLGDLQRTLVREVLPEQQKGTAPSTPKEAAQNITLLQKFEKIKTSTNMCKICMGKDFEILGEKKKRCMRCMTTWEED